MSRSQVAAAVAKNKERHPELFCPVKNCLWNLKSGPCRKHSAQALPLESHAPALDELITCPRCGAAGVTDRWGEFVTIEELGKDGEARPAISEWPRRVRMPRQVLEFKYGCLEFPDSNEKALAIAPVGGRIEISSREEGLPPEGIPPYTKKGI